MYIDVNVISLVTLFQQVFTIRLTFNENLCVVKEIRSGGNTVLNFSKISFNFILLNEFIPDTQTLRTRSVLH